MKNYCPRLVHKPHRKEPQTSQKNRTVQVEVFWVVMLSEYLEMNLHFHENLKSHIRIGQFYSNVYEAVDKIPVLQSL